MVKDDRLGESPVARGCGPALALTFVLGAVIYSVVAVVDTVAGLGAVGVIIACAAAYLYWNYRKRTPPSSQGAGRKPVRDPDLISAVSAAIEDGRKIQAVKIYRDATGASLKEAKEAIDTW